MGEVVPSNVEKAVNPRSTAAQSLTIMQTIAPEESTSSTRMLS
jgi:hypothetical protein